VARQTDKKVDMGGKTDKWVDIYTREWTDGKVDEQTVQITTRQTRKYTDIYPGPMYKPMYRDTI